MFLHSDIGISTGAYAGLPLAAVLLLIRELAPAAEITSYGSHSLLELDNARAVAASGLPFSVHGPFFRVGLGSTSEAKRRAAVELHRRHLKISAILGATLYLVHPDRQRKRQARQPAVITALRRSFAELRAYQEEYGVPVAVVRPFNIYGPNQIGVGAIHHFVRHAIANEEITVHNDGAQIRAWCYMDDIADAVLEILENDDAIGQSLNIGNPRSVCTTYDLALRIKRLANSESPIVFKPLEYTDVEIRIPDITRSREVLKWEPKVDLDEGLLRTIEWYRAESGSAAK